VVQEPASVAMYPNLAEILAELPPGNPLPLPLIEELRRRYDAHGWEYDSGQRTSSDDRPVNLVMSSDSRQLAREELVDAVWNLLVLNLKERLNWKTLAALELCQGALKLL
jgi:hypothetical protein